MRLKFELLAGTCCMHIRQTFQSRWQGPGHISVTPFIHVRNDYTNGEEVDLHLVNRTEY